MADSPSTPADTPAVTPPVTQPGDWEVRFKGLQTLLNQRDSALATKDATISTMVQEAHEFQEKLTKAEAAQKAKDDQLAKLALERDQSQATAATAAKQLDRLKAIAKYPGLFPDEDAGLLRTDLEGESFGKFLADYAARLGQTSKEAVEKTLNGATPTAEGGTRQATPTRSVLMKQIREAQQKSDKKAEDAAYAALRALP